MRIVSCVGGHSINVYEDCVYDSEIRKFRGGKKKAEIPFSGKMLSAKVYQEKAESIDFQGVSIETMTPQVFEDVDPIPDESECDYCIVSAMYVSACKALGYDTSRLLTIGTPVVDDNNMTIGCCGFNRN